MAVIGDLKSELEAIRALDPEHPDECRIIALLVELLPWADTRGRLEKRESPDFELSLSGWTVGVEVTRVTNQIWEAAAANAHSGGGLGRSVRRLKRALTQGLGGRRKRVPRHGHESSQDHWASLIAKAVAAKSETFHRPHFKRDYAQNWLLIMDKTPDLTLDREQRVRSLNERTRGLAVDAFDKVFVIGRYGRRHYLLGEACGEFEELASAVLWSFEGSPGRITSE